MFGIKRLKTTEEEAALKEALRKGKQEREAARLGLETAVRRLLREVQSIPLDRHVEMVANDLAAAGRGDDASS
jgi:hypothetical protein